MKRHFYVPIVALLLSLTALSVQAFGPAQQSTGPAPDLGRDLSVKLAVPLFNKTFAETPVASAGDRTILLKDLTPQLTPTTTILFWEKQTSPEELSLQFKQALDNRIKQEQVDPKLVRIYAEPRIGKDRTLQLQPLLFSDLFATTPVALVNGEPVTIAEFANDLESVHSEVMGDHADSGAGANIHRLIERLISVRLIEQEARNIGLDQTGAFRKQADEFAEKTLLYTLLDREAGQLTLDQAAVDELYRQISLQGKFRSIRFSREQHAKEMLEACRKGSDFDKLATAAIESGKAVEAEQQGYIRFKDLLTNVASEAARLEIGEVSQIFRQADGFLIFKLIDKQFVEDPQALKFAQGNVWEKQTTEAGAAYITATVDKHAKFDEQAGDALDFKKIKAETPDILLSGALDPLLKDQRVLVEIPGGDPDQLTVADIAGKIKETYFHGTDIALNADEVDAKKDQIIEDTLFRISGKIEADQLGITREPEYQRKVAEFERRLLFDIFMQKVVTPEVRLQEDEIRAYYDAHINDFQTPAMLKIRSLPFYKEQDARNAVDKLSKGSDFKWVSANVEGLVDVQDQNLLQFDQRILSLTSLPADLQSEAAKAKRGETLIYAEPKNFFYVLYFENLYPPEPRPYEQVRKDILNTVFQERVKQTLDDWVGKLKEAYDTEIFLVTETK